MSASVVIFDDDPDDAMQEDEVCAAPAAAPAASAAAPARPPSPEGPSSAAAADVPVFAVLSSRRARGRASPKKGERAPMEYKVQFANGVVVWSGAETLIDPDGSAVLVRSTGRPFSLEDKSTWEWKGFADHPPIMDIVTSQHDRLTAERYNARADIRASDPIGYELIAAYRERLTGKGPIAELGVERLPSLIRAFDAKNCIYRVQGIYPMGRAYSVMVDDEVINFGGAQRFRTNDIQVAIYAFATLAEVPEKNLMTREEVACFTVL